MFSASKLQLLIFNNKLNIETLSTQTSINASTIIRLLNGTTINPQPETVNSLARYFGVSPNELYETKQSWVSVSKTKPKNIKEMLEYLLLRTGILNTSMLHKLSGIPKSNLDRILSGETIKPNITTLEQLANFFNLSIAQITGLENDHTNDLNTLSKQSSRLPLITFDLISDWYNDKLSGNINYIQSTGTFSASETFALLIESDILRPDFKAGNILIIDSASKPDYGDFILARTGSDYFLCEFYGIQDNKISYRSAGNSKTKHINLEYFTMHGVIVQEIINRKSK